MSYETFLKKNPEIGIKICPICNKRFIPSLQWAYKKDKVFFCRYNCYREGGGDGAKTSMYTRKSKTNKKRK
jgi:hypothetical protein